MARVRHLRGEDKVRHATIQSVGPRDVHPEADLEDRHTDEECLAAGPTSASVFDTPVMSMPGLLGYYPLTPSSQANSTMNGYTGTLLNGAVIGGPGSGPPVNDPNSSALVLATGATGTAYATAGGSNPLLGGIDQSGSIISCIKLASLPSTLRSHLIDRGRVSKRQ